MAGAGAGRRPGRGGLGGGRGRAARRRPTRRHDGGRPLVSHPDSHLGHSRQVRCCRARHQERGRARRGHCACRRAMPRRACRMPAGSPARRSPPIENHRSTVLPLPWAFSRLGVVPGLAVTLAVALGNALAGTLLLRAAGALDCHSFEGLADRVGGRSWRLFTQLSLLLLLFGNLVADWCAGGQLARRAPRPAGSCMHASGLRCAPRRLPPRLLSHPPLTPLQVPPQRHGPDCGSRAGGRRQHPRLAGPWRRARDAGGAGRPGRLPSVRHAPPARGASGCAAYAPARVCSRWHVPPARGGRSLQVHTPPPRPLPRCSWRRRARRASFSLWA